MISSYPPRERRRRRRRGVAIFRFALRLLLAGAIFGGGVALGEALHDNPRPSGTITRIRTQKPLPLPPIRRTVTVTTRG
jgi:hypothetical protein